MAVVAVLLEVGVGLLVVVEAGQRLLVEDAVVAAVENPGLPVDADDVGGRVLGVGEARVGQEPISYIFIYI